MLTATSPLFAQVGKPAPISAPAPVSALVSQVDIPYQQFTLTNGLRVIVHTDRKAPVVAVSVWYDVGAKHEPKGKTGFAHLFEHLMFNGSENAPDDFFEPLKQVGATDYNGTTNLDRTNYFETVPTAALERALFLESDRMGYLLGAVTQGKLDEQRGVVQNEKRQGDNRPYGLVRYKITEGLYPADHPYGHDTIGSMADLDAASLQNGEERFSSTLGRRFNLDTVCPSWHRNRNRLNTNLPKTMSDANRQGWQIMSAGKSLFHMLGWRGWDNTKFLSKDGHREAVCNGYGRIITSGPNIGTYNYYNPETHPQEHNDMDVMPLPAFAATNSIIMMSN